MKYKIELIGGHFISGENKCSFIQFVSELFKKKIFVIDQGNLPWVAINTEHIILVKEEL